MSKYIVGTIKCNKCGVYFLTDTNEIKSEVVLEEDFDLLRSKDSMVVKGFLNLRVCGTEYYDINEKEKTFIICPFCNNKHYISQKIIKTFYTREEKFKD